MTPQTPPNGGIPASRGWEHLGNPGTTEARSQHRTRHVRLGAGEIGHPSRHPLIPLVPLDVLDEALGRSAGLP